MAGELFHLFYRRRSNYKTYISHAVLLLLVLGSRADDENSILTGTQEHGTDVKNTVTDHPSAHEWSYEGEGKWTHDFEACKGHHQSPIAITTNSCYTNLTSRPFVFNEGYRRPPAGSTMINTGHTAQITISENATFSGGPLPDGSYTFVQLHFHWGGNDSLGSEHTLDGKRYPLELHLVHYHQNYSSFGDGLGKKGGVVVLAIWFELSDNDNEVLNPLMDALQNTKSKGDTSRINSHDSLFDFLPQNKNSYFHYDGSLTTPTCNENVLWILFRSTESISHAQLEAFRGLQEEKTGAPSTHHLENNFRHLQPLYDRTVYLVGSACGNSPTTGFLSLLIGLTISHFTLY